MPPLMIGTSAIQSARCRGVIMLHDAKSLLEIKTLSYNAGNFFSEKV